MLFPPASASFQAMASLPPEPGSAAVASEAGVLSCPTSSSRRDVGGGDGGGGGGDERAGTDYCAGTESGAKKPPGPSLKQSLAAAIVSAAARDAAEAAEAAGVVAGGGGTATTRTKKVPLKPKRSAKPRRRASGGRAGRTSSNEANPRSESGVDGGSNDGAGTSGKASEATTPRRPTRNLRRPRQESMKQSGQATTTAATSAAIASPTGVSPSGDTLGSPRQRVGTNRKKGSEGVQQTNKSATPVAANATATATVASGEGSASRTSPTTRPQRGGSPCRPPPRRTSLHPPPGERESSGRGEAALGLPAGLELIPGFEDTIDSHYMTALLEKDSSDTQSGVAGSTFASAESQGLEAGIGGGRGSGNKGGGVSFGSGPDASLGLAGALLLGCDTQPSAAAYTDATTDDASQRHLSKHRNQSVQKPGEDRVSLDTDGGRVDIARSSTAQHEAGDAPTLLPALAEAPAVPAMVASAVAAPPLPRPVMEPVRSASSISIAAGAAGYSDATGELTAATGPGVTKGDGRQTQRMRSATASPPETAREQAKRETETSSPAPVLARNMKHVMEPAVGSQSESTTAPAAALAGIDDLQGPTQVEVEAVAAQVRTAVVAPEECVLDQRDTGATVKRPRRTEDAAEGASRAPSVLPPPSSVAAPRGPLEHSSAPMAIEGVKNGALAPPAAPLGVAPAAEVAGTPSSPPRPLPRKVSLRFAPRDTSTESKLSAHGYLPFQKLTAPVSFRVFLAIGV